MPLTVSTAALRLARELGILYRGAVTTSGSTTTLADGVFLLGQFQDDFFNRGVCWITYDAGGASAAPEGQMRTITDYDDLTGTITTRAFTAGISGDDVYALTAGERWSGYVLADALNSALHSIGKLPLSDTSLTTAASQTEYTLPAALYGQDLKRVSIQGRTGDADDNAWIPYYDWYVQYGGTGTQDTLIFNINPTAGRTIKLDYNGVHPLMEFDEFGTIENVSISEQVPEDLLVKYAVVHALEFGAEPGDKQDRAWNDKLERAYQALQVSKAENRVRRHSGGKIMVVDAQRPGKTGRYGEYLG